MENAELKASLSRLEVANCQVLTEKGRLEAEVGELKAEAAVTKGKLDDLGSLKELISKEEQLLDTIQTQSQSFESSFRQQSTQFTDQ